MTRPLLVAAAPVNLLSMVTTAEMSVHEKALVAGLKMPTQSALCGEKTTRPLLINAAKANL